MFGKIIKKSSKILTKEHENILKVAGALSKECKLVEQGKEINEDFFRKAIDFIRNYADKFHHAKEEDILFKEFNKQVEKDLGCVHCNPVEQMLVEHNEGREFVKGMEKSLNKSDKEKLIENAMGYVNLIQEHISKEDNILYPMVDDVLDEEVERKILEKFKGIERDYEGKNRYEEFVENIKLKGGGK